MWELGLIILVALILLGPRQLTETARVLGRLYREVTKLTTDLRNSVDLDSLTSTTSSPSHLDADPVKPAAEQDPKPDMDLLAAPGERSGPDFYADLLESTKEEAEGEKSPDTEPSEEGPQPEEVASETGKDPGESVEKRDG